jgi:hypothetical protein
MDVIYGVQKLVYYMLMHDLTILIIPYKPFTSLPLAILVFNKINTT